MPARGLLCTYNTDKAVLILFVFVKLGKRLQLRAVRHDGQRLYDGRKLDEIRGLSYGYGGAVVHNPERHAGPFGGDYYFRLQRGCLSGCGFGGLLFLGHKTLLKMCVLFGFVYLSNTL
jgi:hypothetical protein